MMSFTFFIVLLNAILLSLYIIIVRFSLFYLKDFGCYCFLFFFFFLDQLSSLLFVRAQHVFSFFFFFTHYQVNRTLLGTVGCRSEIATWSDI